MARPRTRARSCSANLPGRVVSVHVLLRADVGFRAEIEKEWSADGASGVFSPHGYLIGSPQQKGTNTWLWMSVASHAVDGGADHARDLYAAAAQRWVDEGHKEHAVF